MGLSMGSASWLALLPAPTPLCLPISPVQALFPSSLCLLFAINVIHASPAGPCHPAQGRRYISVMSRCGCSRGPTGSGFMGKGRADVGGPGGQQSARALCGAAAQRAQGALSG